MSVKKPIIIVAAVVTVTIISAAVCAALLYFQVNESELQESEPDVFESEEYEEENPGAVAVYVYDLSEHSREGIITAHGAAVSAKTSNLTAPLTSAVTNVYVYLGQYVSEGDLICEFDTSEIQDRIDELEAEDEEAAREADVIHRRNMEALNAAETDQKKQLGEAEAEIQKIRSDMDELLSVERSRTTSESDEEKATELEELNAALDEATENYEDILETTNEEIKACQEAIEDEELDKDDNSKELEELRQELASAVVTAPQSGKITSLSIQQGSAPDESLCTISDMNNIVLNVNVKESDILNVRVGMNVLIYPDATDQILKGVVSETLMVANTADEDTENLYTVTISPTDDFPWAVGMKVSVDILFQERQFLFDVPNEYLYTDENGSFVFVAKNNYHGSYTAVKRRVETGFKHAGGFIEINFDGIKKNSMIVMCRDANAELYDGTELELEEELE